MKLRSITYLSRKYGVARGRIEYAIYRGILKAERRPHAGLLRGFEYYVDEDELKSVIDMVRSLPELRYVYASRAARSHGLTMHQIREAIRRGLIQDYYLVRNPYNRFSTSILINEVELTEKIGKIRKLEKRSEEERRRERVYRLRSKARKEVSFYCPRCKQVVRPRRDSLAFEAYWERELGLNDARKTLIIAHYRHYHTSYDKERVNAEKWLTEEEIRALKRALAAYKSSKDREERDLWLETIRELKDRAVERCRVYYNKEALKLAIEDGLLAADAGE